MYKLQFLEDQLTSNIDIKLNLSELFDKFILRIYNKKKNLEHKSNEYKCEIFKYQNYYKNSLTSVNKLQHFLNDILENHNHLVVDDKLQLKEMLLLRDRCNILLQNIELKYKTKKELENTTKNKIII